MHVARLLAPRGPASASGRLSVSTSTNVGAAVAATSGPIGARKDTPPPPAGRYLLTGACGQIGHELVNALSSILGGEAVVATDARAAPPSPLPEGVRYQRLDVRDERAVKQAINEVAPTHVIHLAAMLSATGEKDPATALAVNVGGVHAVLSAAESVGAAVFAPSTIAVYGRAAPRLGCGDDAPQFPSTVYGASKSYLEGIGAHAAARGSVDFRSLRLPGVISADAPPGGGTTDYACAMFEAALGVGEHAGSGGGKYQCYLSPDAALPFAYMPDVIDGILRLIGAPEDRLTRRTFSVQGASFSPAELATAIAKRVPFDVTYKPDFRDAIARSWPASLDDTNARSDWGWSPSSGVEEMVDALLARVASRSARAGGVGADAAAAAVAAAQAAVARGPAVAAVTAAAVVAN